MLNPTDGFYGTGTATCDQNKGDLREKDNTSVNDSQIAKSSQHTVLPYIKDGFEHPNVKTDSTGKWVDKRRRINTAPYQSNLRQYQIGKNWNLPKELKDLFTPLKCNLCHCAMGSTITAKDHYEGKKHISNIKKWMSEHPEYSEQYSVLELSQPKIVDPERLYCKFCDVMMSSEQQAQSHYVGKKHQSVMNSGVMKNAFLNPSTGQWERCKSIIDDGRFGIGSSFLKGEIRPKETTSGQKFFCDICQVPCPSQITFNDHLAGAKHIKRMTLLMQNGQSSPALKDNILEDVIKNDKKVPSLSDLSIYRTPSGKYYCHSCDVRVNSPIQFLQHCDSRKHKHKSSLSANRAHK
ncbi:UNVERIFIED_CONTAM: hypothetical protein PYX00_009496 [Menopon gallinae]|uniref:Matrin-type domain-containing protein n=1 Tax=Menopon gallinae TaxID=328185 RepID=A0AAW2HC75_9NEOP